MLRINAKTFLSLLLFIALSGYLFGQENPDQSIESDTTLSLDKGWPRTIEMEDATVIFHQPQVYKWDNFETLGAWIATEVFPKGDNNESIVGSIKAEAKTDTDLEKRAVLITDKELLEVKFDNANAGFEEIAEERLRSLHTSPELISLDRMLPMIDDTLFNLKGVEMNTDPPEIFYTTDQNSILVMFDGEPIWAPTDRENLKYALNTNWLIFKYEIDGDLFLLNEGKWLTSKSINGPWERTNSLPKDLKKLAKEDDWKDLSNVVPAKSSDLRTPTIFTSTLPAELIVFMGSPKVKSIDEAEGLKSVYNTDADVFFSEGDKKYYFLVSGRWFKASDLNGPWEFASDKLPAVFQRIPEDSDWGHILSTVPGTIQAKEAAIQALIPQKESLSRDTKPPEVKYDGEPIFENIDGTDMKYATNTQSDIIYVDNNYYWCYQGAWFVSAYPTYGWSVCYSVHPSIYTIPPHYPVYHVSYVHCYGYTSSHVTFGYSAGYMGVHVSFGVPFYGTGYYYSPYYHYPGYGYPMYYPYHHSYGCRATYNPYTGTYGRQALVYGPYGGAGRGAYYNPRTGAYARGRSAWGPYGGAGEAIAYNPRTGNYGATRQGYNSYGSWGESVVGNKDRWAHTGHYTDRNGTRYGFETSEGTKGIGFKGDQGKSGKIVMGKEGDLYVGGNGAGVFKKDGDNWYRRNEGNWDQVQWGDKTKLSQGQQDKVRESIQNKRPDLERENIQDRSNVQRNLNQSRTNTSRNLNRDFNARQRGTYRSNNYNSYQRSRSMPSRPSGGLRGRRG